MESIWSFPRRRTPLYTPCLASAVQSLGARSQRDRIYQIRQIAERHSGIRIRARQEN